MGRPCVAQAKVHIIHSLSRQVKNLRNRKCSTEKQKEQNERKVTRYVLEIELLKKSSRDSISRYVLITKKSFKDVVRKESKKQKYNMKLRAFVRVSEHNSVKKIIDKFRNEYPDWESNLPKLIQSLGKKKKKVKATDVDDDSENISGEESDHDSEDNDGDEDAVQENDDADESDTKEVVDSNDNASLSDQEMESGNDSDEDKGDDDLFVASLKQAISSDKVKDSKNNRQV